MHIRAVPATRRVPPREVGQSAAPFVETGIMTASKIQCMNRMQSQRMNQPAQCCVHSLVWAPPVLQVFLFSVRLHATRRKRTMLWAVSAFQKVNPSHTVAYNATALPPHFWQRAVVFFVFDSQLAFQGGGFRCGFLQRFVIHVGQVLRRRSVRHLRGRRKQERRWLASICIAFPLVLAKLHLSAVTATRALVSWYHTFLQTMAVCHCQYIWAPLCIGGSTQHLADGVSDGHEHQHGPGASQIRSCKAPGPRLEQSSVSSHPMASDASATPGSSTCVGMFNACRKAQAS